VRNRFQFAVALLFIDMNDTTLPLRNIQYLVREALTKTDKADIKTMIRKELESEMKAKLSKAVEEEVAKALKNKSTKEEIGEISKKIIKKLYKDLSLHHPYIIDRIKV
jgi:transcriptional accessory protein Tex/SPT6